MKKADIRSAVLVCSELRVYTWRFPRIIGVHSLDHDIVAYFGSLVRHTTHSLSYVCRSIFAVKFIAWVTGSHMAICS